MKIYFEFFKLEFINNSEYNPTPTFFQEVVDPSTCPAELNTMIASDCV